MQKVKIAAIQMRPELGRKEANIANACKLFRKATSLGATIACLPELWNSGYLGLGARHQEFAEPVPGPTTRTLCDLAKEESIFIVGGSIIELAGKVMRNTASLISPDGKLSERIKPTTEDTLFTGDLKSTQRSLTTPVYPDV